MRAPILGRLPTILILATAGWLAAVPVLADPVAVVAAVKGRVEVTSGATRRTVRAAFGRPLERGDKVSVGPNGTATLFFNDGNVIELSERSAITIGGRLAADARGAALPGEVYAQVSRFVTAGSRQTGLVAMAGMRSDGGGSAPLLLAPRLTSILVDAPTLSWRAVTGATGYRVRVSSADGAERWSREVPAGAPGAELELAYPPDVERLAAEADHQWEVEALDDRGALRRESTVIHVLSPASRETIRANLARIADGAGGTGSPAARFLAGSYLSGLGLHQDAAEQFRQLAALAPDSPSPHEALGNVYLGVGLVDLAASEFKQALALQRDVR
jgi:hypothetical protein